MAIGLSRVAAGTIGFSLLAFGRGESMGNTGKGVEIPLHSAKAGLWTAQRGWLIGSGSLQQGGEGAHPEPTRLGSFVRGELSREDNRAVVRHLLTGCPACSGVLRPLLGQADLPLPRTGGR